MKYLILLFLFFLPVNLFASTLEISTPATNLGIGTTDTTNNLSLTTGMAIGNTSYTETTSPNAGAIIQGNVGIGSFSPTQALDVNGTVRMTGFNMRSGATSGYFFISDNNGNGTWQNVSPGSSQWSGINPVYMQSGYNVGIGSSLPGTVLDVQGTVRNLGETINGTGIQGEPINKGYELVVPSPNLSGGSNEVDQMLQYEGNLLIGYGASGSSPIYKWTGQTFSLLHSFGTQPHFEGVPALANYNGNIYAANLGNSLGDGSVYVSSDGGNTWSLSYSSGNDYFIYSLAVFKGNLYAGAGYLSSRIYKYNGTTWSTSYAGQSAPAGLVNALYPYKGILFTGIGNGGSSGGILSSPDGITWTQELSGETIFRIDEFKGHLYATSEGTTPAAIYVRNDANATWSIVTTFTGMNQCDAMATYDNTLYLGCTTGSTYANIYKSYDGVNYILDAQLTGASGADEVFSMLPYDGSLYIGLGFQSDTTADLWRKTDSLGQQSDWWSTFLNKFRQNTNNGYNWPNDPSMFNVTTPIGFDSNATFSGNVGIGSTSPAANLDVEGTGNIILNAGTVGIGTMTPTATNVQYIVTAQNNANGLREIAMLNQNSGTSTAAGMEVKSADNDGYIRDYSTNNSVALFAGRTALFNESGNGLLINTFSSGDLRLGAIDQQVMEIGSSNVGIGTITPGQILDVRGTVSATNLTVTSLNSGTQCLQANSSGVVSGTGSACGSGGGSGGNFWNEINNDLYPTSLAYNVGIGTSLPGEVLDVNGTVRSTSFIQTGTIPNIFTGNVGVSTLNPQENLEVGNSNNLTANANGNDFRISRATTNDAYSGHVDHYLNGFGDYFIQTSGITGKLQLGGGGTTVDVLSSSHTNPAILSLGDQFASTNSSWDLQHYAYFPGTSASDYVQWYLNPSTQNYELTRNDSNVHYLNIETPSLFTGGNVGIGSSVPGQALDVTGTVRAIGFTGNASNVTNLPITLTTTGSSGAASWTQSTDTLNIPQYSGGGGSSQWTTSNTNDIYLPNSGNVGIGTAFTTTSALTIMNGNVGIGTWLPQGQLDVEGTQSKSIFSGNVGIGTLKPQDLLQVNGNVGIGTFNSTGIQAFAPNGTNSLPAYSFYNSTGTGMLYTGTQLALALAGADIVLIQSSGVTSAGYGITFSTNAQAGGLAMDNGEIAWGVSTTMDSDLSRIASGIVAVGNGTAQNTTGTLVAKNIGIGTVNPLSSLIVSTGNVGIGTNLTQGELDVEGTVNNILLFSNGQTPQPNVGIGTLSPGVALDVQGTVRSSLGFISGSGSATLTGSGSNVGINSTTPGSTLDVGGTIRTISFTSRSATCATIGPVGTCWTSTGQLGYCSGAASVCTTCTAC